jgi:hypothetical protein
MKCDCGVEINIYDHDRVLNHLVSEHGLSLELAEDMISTIEGNSFLEATKKDNNEK